MLRRSVAIPVLLALAIPAELLAATRKVPQQFTTIQAAITAAAPGDTIKISKGVYKENVVVDKLGLVIKGTDGVIVDARPDPLDGSGAGFFITGAGVTIEKLTVRHARAPAPIGGASLGANFFVDGSSVTIKNVVSEHPSDFHIASTAMAGGLRVQNCSFEGTGFSTMSASCRFESCTFHHASGLEIVSGDALVKDCRFDDCGGGVLAFAPNADIRNNRMRNVRVFPLFSINSGVVFRGNKLDGCSGIIVNGDDATIDDNDITHSFPLDPTHPTLFVSDCANAMITDNRISDCTGGGIALAVDATNATVSRNSVKRCSRVSQVELLSLDSPFQDAGIEVHSNNGTISQNTVKECTGDGIHVTGGGNQILDNVVKSCLEDGIDNEGAANTVNGNDARKNQAEGIENNGTNTVMNDNVAAKNRIDIANNGSFMSFSNNQPAGTPPPPEIDLP